MATSSEVLSWRGQDALDADGEKIGSIEQIYLAAESNQPEWALVNTGLLRRPAPKRPATRARRAATHGVGETSGELRGGGRVSGQDPDEAMTRSEEELAVGTAQRETGRARLKKYVVEDEVTETVPVQREEVRVEREPITDANRDAAMSGPEISEAEHEVVLHEEEPVAEKRAVPTERIRLGKDVEEDQHGGSDTVRKEHIDVDDSGNES